jgi:hypothetical protein
MFSKQDYANYFGDLELIFKKTLEIYTDLINEISDQSIRNKLLMLAEENMDAFNFLNQTKNKYFKQQ